LGDLLGTLHRGAATGILELQEDRGREHRIHLARGLIVAVEFDGEGPSLAEMLRAERAVEEDVLRRSVLRAMASSRLHGEVLVHDFHLSPVIVGRMLRCQVLDRLARLERLADARVTFRVAVRPPHSCRQNAVDATLAPQDFLHGRRRARPRHPTETITRAESTAWDALGLPPGAPVGDIKRAYRRLARGVHPDLHPNASDEERRRLQAAFAELTEAYRALVA
jgi:hypothetical protein